MKSQNEKLEERISQKQNQLKTLKELFLETASKKSETGSSNYNLQKLLADSDDETPGGSRAWSASVLRHILFLFVIEIVFINILRLSLTFNKLKYCLLIDTKIDIKFSKSTNMIAYYK